MSIKVKFDKEIHIFKGQESFKNLQNFVKTSFKYTPKSYLFQYEDLEGDFITISCDEDLKFLRETQGSQNLKIFITEELNSSQEFEELMISDQQPDSEPELLAEEKLSPQYLLKQNQQLHHQNQNSQQQQYQDQTFRKEKIQALVKQEIQQQLPFIIEQVKQSLQYQQEKQKQTLILEQKETYQTQQPNKAQTIESNIIGQPIQKNQDIQQLQQIQVQEQNPQLKQVNYTTEKEAKKIKEVLQGKKKDNLVQKIKKTDQTIGNILEDKNLTEKFEPQKQHQIQRNEQQSQLNYQLEDIFNEPQNYTQTLQESKPYNLLASLLQQKVDQVREFTGYYDDEQIKDLIIQNPELPIEDIIEIVLTWIQQWFQQQEQKQKILSLQHQQQQAQQKKKKELKKQFGFKVRSIAEQVSEVLGGEAETYYGVIDYLPNYKSVNEVVLDIMEDQTLMEKHSSYKQGK